MSVEATAKKKRTEETHSVATYPADHLAGMRVPKGGSDCAKCEYLKDAKKRICRNEYFIAWEGPNKPAGSAKIPAPIDEYCSDFYEVADAYK